MHEKRYQVFISSTFTDLQEERRAVQDAVISMGDFPVQMESFPATDQSQMEYIGPLIAQSDYYVLIIGGRYGTVDETGMSFTHQEFKFAIEKRIPVLVLVHGNPNDIAVGKAESTDAGRAKLAAFIEEASFKRIRKDWRDRNELKLRVHEALDHAKRSNPRPGWVRGDTIASFDALEELNEVRKENQKFREKLGNLAVDIPLPNIPAANELTEISLQPHSVSRGFSGSREGSAAKIQASWISFFPIVFSNLEYDTSDWNGDYYFHVKHDESCIGIGSAIASAMIPADVTGAFKLSRLSLDRLLAYYTEAGLMLQDNLGEKPWTEIAQRVARLHHIAGQEVAFAIVDGEVTVTSAAAGDDYDKIPF